MKHLLLSIITLHLVLGGPVKIQCPNNCKCLKLNEISIKAKCLSYDFLNNLTNQQISTIKDLSIINKETINEIDPKLKYLKNLQYLDLSNNQINKILNFPNLINLKQLNLSGNLLNKIQLNELPENLELFDISSNLIKYIPNNWNHLKKLKFLQLHDNPIDCDCDILVIYKNLINSGIEIPIAIKCNSPKDFYGKTLNSLNCSLITDNLLNSMIADTDLNLNPFYDDNNEQIDNDNEEFLSAIDTKIHKRSNDEDEFEDGSGFDGSGDFIDFTTIPTIITDDITESVPKACHVNCSTAKPVGIDDEKNASPLPPLKEQIGIIFDDIIHHHSDNESIETTTQQPSTTSSTTITTIINKIIEEKEIEEPEIIKDTDKVLVETVPINNTVLGELERASISNSNSHNYMYIIIAIVLTIIVIFTIYKLVKKNSNQNNRRNRPIDNGIGEELKLLKPTIDQKPKQPQIQPENVPLLNGQNGTKKSDDNNGVGNGGRGGGDNTENNEVELRKNFDKELLLTPQLERVTIKAAELTDSIPRTPILVQRHANGDGEIITTTLCE